MARSRNKKRKAENEPAPVPAPERKARPEASPDGSPLSRGLIPFKGFKAQAMVLLLLGLVFYGNSFFNQYALDDGIMIAKNEYVQAGISGIGDLLTRDSYASFYAQSGGRGELSGGRYRPLSQVTFAVEQEFFGNNAFIRHFVNVALYILSVILLLYFLRVHVFPARPELAFLTALIFLIHPIHTEVVANVKSRDEIMSFLFIVLTFIYAFRFETLGKKGQLVLALLFYFLALLSKEYAITLLALIPLACFLFLKRGYFQSGLRALPFLGVALVYVFIRVGATAPLPAEAAMSASIPKDVFNDPYQFAESSQLLPSKIYILYKYLQLQVFPHPLSADYSYNHFPYRNFRDPLVILSVLIHLIMLLAGVWLFAKRHFLAFAIAFYLANLVLVGNLFFDIGATMGERLVYHSSFGFAMFAAWALYEGFGLIKSGGTRRKAFYAALGLVTILAGARTVTRNAEWSSDESLWLADVETVPGSALANGNAGNQMIIIGDRLEVVSEKNERYSQAIEYLQKSLNIYPRYVNSLINLGLVYYRLEDYGKAEKYWDRARTIFPTNKHLLECYNSLATYYFSQGLQYGVKGNFPLSIDYMEKAKTLDPENGLIWANLGGAFYTVKDYEMAEKHWRKSLEYLPGNADAANGLQALKQLKLSPPDRTGN